MIGLYGMIGASWLWAAGPVWAAEPLHADVVDDYVVEQGGGRVNWTRLEIEATAAAYGSGTQVARKAIEQRAMSKVAAAMEALAPSVALSLGHDIGALWDEPQLAESVKSRLSRWEVSQVRYHASGKVELDGTLSLMELLKPWMMARSHPAPTEGVRQGHTGLLLDARGLGAKPCYAPRILADDGSELWDAALWTEASLKTVPAVYVTDPAHRAAVRAGAKPFFAVAEQANDASFSLSHHDTLRFRTAMTDTTVLGEGTVVIVLDPP